MRYDSKSKGSANSYRGFALPVKAAIAVAICLTVRLLMAQAPAPPAAAPAVPEETDAQGYKYQVPSATLSKGPKAKAIEGEERRRVRQILTSPGSIAAEPATRQRFRAYFQQYLFPMMTTEDGLKTVAADRLLFFRDLLGHKNNEAHAEVINLTFPAMAYIVQDPAYRLPARYNAMLIISNLNDQEPNPYSAPQTLPEPMRAALKFILQQFQKPDNHDSIKTAALLGLARHLEWENYKQAGSAPMPPADRVEVIKELTALAETKQPPSGREAEVHNWMRRRAIEGLCLACLTRADSGIAATMENLLKDETDVLSVRTMVATSLGRMSLQAPAKIDPVATAKELGYLALVACDAELNRAKSFRKNEAEREARLMGTYSGEIDYSRGPGQQGYGAPGMGMPGEGGPGGLRAPIRPVPGAGGTLDGGGGLGGSEYGGMAGMDPSMMDPKHYRIEYLRRRIRQHLYAVQLGLTGGEDHAPPRAATPNANQKTTVAKTAATETVPAAEKKGVLALAKAVPEQTAVKNVYYLVRRLAEIVEVAGAEADFFQLVKDLERELKPLEAITKRLPAPGAATPTGLAEDEPSLPTPGGKAGGKAATGKTAPAKAAPAPPAAKGKAASRGYKPSAPAVFGRPR